MVVILKVFSCTTAFQRKKKPFYCPFNISAADIWSSIHSFPFLPSQESQISDLRTLFGDPCCSNEASVERVTNKGTGSR